MEPVLLTVEEAATRKGVSKARIYAAIAQKRLPRYFVEGKVAVREVDFLAWINERRTGGWPEGSELSEEHKLKISLAQQRRLSKKKSISSKKSR